MQRQGFDDPAADRRRDDLARPHRGQGRRASTTARWSGSRTPPARCRSRPRCSATTQRPKLLADVKADYDSLRTRHAAKHDRPMVDARARPGQPRRRSTGTGYARRPAPRVTAGRRTCLRRLRPRRAARVHRLAAVLQRLGDEGQVPRHPQQPGDRRDRPQAVRRRAGDARPDRSTEKWLTASGVFGFFPANAVGDDIEVYPDDTRTEVLTTLHNLRQQGEHRDGVPNRSLGDFVAPKETGLRRPRRRVRGHRRARRPGQDQGVQGRARRLQRDPARVAGRPAGRGVRRAAAPAGAHRVLGLRRPTRTSTTWP